ncbi:hypothetical protein [Candidatus Nitrosotalea okcheonensis]|uniref:Uncharacterized protein n=1 Tax=Candidatus Nitrosotalea okcheonensis TaxID=1903276 RepID=A0A2H1FF80_9ARCH|nr:hypothetical protein [Candidatus Nitrosotalea okcheonensis]SMH71414.1 protein of unknown function [Candidatus Nitrosotalea okcheonensis]
MKKKNYKKIELLFPKIDAKTQQQAFLSQKDIMKRFVATVEDIKDWFESYDIESIELWISGVVQTQGVLKLIISASGESGVMITLKPKTK